MRTGLKKATAVITSLALAFTLLAGIMVTDKVSADDTNLLTGAWDHIHESWEVNDALINNTSVSENANGGFTANISITGWQREWYAEGNMPDDAWPWMEGWCDKPYQLTSSTTMAVEPKSTYQLKFEVINEMLSEVGTPSEKNITITVYSNVNAEEKFMFTTIRVPANGTVKFDRKFNVPESYSGKDVKIEFAYGAYAYSYEISASPFLKLMPDEVREKYVFAPGTTEDVNAKGMLTFNNIEVFKGEYEPLTTEAPTTETPTTEIPTTTQQVQTTTQQPQTTVQQPQTTQQAPMVTQNEPTVSKPKRPSIKAKNIKTKKIRVTWKKVSGATKYQVRAVVGGKTIKKVTSKLKLVLKKLKKNKTYKVSVRAYNSAGYGKWSKVKKVKIKK